MVDAAKSLADLQAKGLIKQVGKGCNTTSPAWLYLQVQLDAWATKIPKFFIRNVLTSDGTGHTLACKCGEIASAWPLTCPVIHLVLLLKVTSILAVL